MRWEFVFAIGVAAGFVWASLIWLSVCYQAGKRVRRR